MKSLILIILIIVLSIPAVLSLFKADFYSSHDGVTHVIRFLKFHQNLSEGQFPPKWSDGISFGLGSPVLMFNAPLPYFIAEVPKFLGAEYSSSIEIIFALGLILSGLTFFFWIKDIFGNIPAFVGALFYVYAPYRFIDIYVRGAYPESFAFIFPPLILLSIKKVIEKGKLRWFAIGILSLMGIILSHNVAAMLFLAVAIIYAVFLSFLEARFKRLFLVFLMIIFALGISSFYWVPAYFEKGYTNLDKLNSSRSFDANFVSLNDIVYSKWNWGPVRSESPMSPQLGITQILAIILTLIIILVNFIKKQKIKTYLLGYALLFICLILFSIFLMTNYSLFLWERVSLLSFVLYPWRFLMIALFCSATVASLVVYMFKNSKIIVVIFIILLFYANKNHSQLVGIVNGNNDYFFKINNTTDMWGEFLPIGANLDTVYKCKIGNCYFNKVISTGIYNLQEIEHKNNLIKYKYETILPTFATINIFYFPGWEIYIDDKKINEVKINKLGTMDIELPTGEHFLKTKFSNTTLRNMAIVISAISFSVTGGVILWLKRYFS